MQKIEIDFDENDIKDMNGFADMIRDRVSRVFSEKTICEQLGVSPARMTLNEKIAFSSEIENDTIIVASNVFIQSDELAEALDYKGSGLQGLIKSAAILEILGFERLAKQMRKLYSELLAESFMAEVREDAYAKKVISQDRSKAGKGNTSRHKEVALRIAKDTWMEYPNASQAGMIDELFAYFRKDRNDNPSSGAIRDWLTQSGLNPGGKGKNRNFKLIING
ncbi:MAG: hypothetical protein LKJ78_08135 [Serratia liquefaciens]|jgi:hypothetical protein|uniref:hypothetical protein n=1 Tax=Serratia proteamaculans TaxID=28151 RepID=UPI0021840D69|nr:hypothetical protein [Serratia proteamaculans]MCH4196476.1 hypothetical protein [Serratia liquefaciens]MCH4230811.1 hypothetical protein [Serratia liquefaciens]MCH4262495.1 hypothetical protein [Serratia liquefaciens]MCI1214616.1 hypothetical protein [Serratia liquefaciens]MCI1235970.1 hypothetical protein [Serratia liquefaciens]